MDLIVFLEGVSAQVLHLLVNVYESHTFTDVLLHLDEEVPVNFHELLHVLRVLAHSFGTFLLVLDFSLHCFLIFGEFLLDVEEEILKQLLIIHNKLIDNRSMHVDTRELIRVAVDDTGHAGEVIRNLLCVCVNDEVVVTSNVFKEIAIVCIVACQRCEFYQVLSVVGLLLPEVEVVVCENT